MNTMSKPLSSAQMVRYHEQEFKNGKENYYSQGDTIPGTWHGSLADGVGPDRRGQRSALQAARRRPASVDRGSSS